MSVPRPLRRTRSFPGQLLLDRFGYPECYGRYSPGRAPRAASMASNVSAGQAKIDAVQGTGRLPISNQMSWRQSGATTAPRRAYVSILFS